MRLTEILEPECIKVPLAATTKKAAIFELVDVLCAQAGISGSDELKDAVWKREQMRTTGIGCGIAIPHGKSPSCGALCMAIGKPANPIDFDAIDGRPVDLIILLASPSDQTGPHIQALATISRMLTDEEFRADLKGADTAEDLHRLLVEQETKVGVSSA